MSPISLVIFDCDGVLVDSERICVKVDAMIMADLGCTFTEAEIIERFVGSSDEVFRVKGGNVKVVLGSNR